MAIDLSNYAGKKVIVRLRSGAYTTGVLRYDSRFTFAYILGGVDNSGYAFREDGRINAEREAGGDIVSIDLVVESVTDRLLSDGAIAGLRDHFETTFREYLRNDPGFQEYLHEAVSRFIPEAIGQLDERSQQDLAMLLTQPISIR